MTKIISSLCLLVILSCTNGTKKPNETISTKDTSLVQPKTDTIVPELDSATIMKGIHKYMTPGKLHKMLSVYNGHWKSQMTIWENPKALPKTSIGTTEFRMTLGGRFQEGKYTSTLLGMPFEGISLLGYDNTRNMFVSSWADNMGTCIVYMEGLWDEETKTIQFAGKTFDPISGKTINIRENFKFIDANNQALETFMDIGGKEFKSMEMKFNRN
jgi:hypothetical protein